MFGTRRIESFKTADFSRLRTKMLEAGRSPKRVNNTLHLLSGMVRHWHRENDLPLPGFRTKLCKVEKNKDALFFAEDDLERMVEAAATLETDCLALLLLGCDAGLRMSECRALQWSDLTFGHRAVIRVQRSREETEDLATKGWKSRSVGMTPRLAEALQAMPRHLLDPHVFVDRWGEPLTRRMVRTRFERVQDAAKVDYGTFHTTRHTFCSYLAMRGVPVGTIRELAGHEHLVTTQRYMHLSPSALDDAIRVLDAEQHGSNVAGVGKETGS